jgi:hypothetical protein
MWLNQNRDKVAHWHLFMHVLVEYYFHTKKLWSSILPIDWYKYSSMCVNFNLVAFVHDIETPKYDGQINQLLTMH